MAQTVNVISVNDEIADENISYTIDLAAAVSNDLNYSGLDAANVTVINADDGDSTGINLSSTAGITSEAGGAFSVDITLNSEPLDDVTIPISVSDSSETTLSNTSLTFTPQNWNVIQSLAVMGVDDNSADGDVAYTIVLAAATSNDPSYAGLNASDISGINRDDESTDIVGVVSSTTTAVTTESGNSFDFVMLLSSPPTDDVSFAISSSNTAEGTVDVSSVTFTPANWSTAQSITVTGVDDADVDGDISYSIVIADSVSNDANYNGLSVTNINVINTDDDAEAAATTPSSGGGALTPLTLLFVAALWLRRKTTSLQKQQVSL